MECKTCDALLADYMHRVSVFTRSVRRLQGLIGRDRDLAHKKLKALKLECSDANDALRAHRFLVHQAFAEGSGAL